MPAANAKTPINGTTVKEAVLSHLIVQVSIFAVTMLVAGVSVVVLANEYLDERVKYGVESHEFQGAHLEGKVYHFESLLGQYQIQQQSLNSDVRDYQSRIFAISTSSDPRANSGL
ncbi:unnamed protein product, partial [marine sediment metagenome]